MIIYYFAVCRVCGFRFYFKQLPRNNKCCRNTSEVILNEINGDAGEMIGLVLQFYFKFFYYFFSLYRYRCGFNGTMKLIGT